MVYDTMSGFPDNSSEFKPGRVAERHPANPADFNPTPFLSTINLLNGKAINDSE